MKFILSLLLLATTAFGQSVSTPETQDKKIDAFIREHNSKRAQNPEGVLFTVRLKDNRKQFRQGEVVTLELSFASSKPDTFTLDTATYDRSGRLDLDYFIIDRRNGIADPLHDYFHSGIHGFMGGGLRGIPELTDKPHLITAELNEWMRFDKPGHYRLYVVSSRVARKGHNLGARVVSNVVEFEVLPADKTWATQKLNEAITVLSKPEMDHHRSACRILRFLGTTAAAIEMRKRLRADENGCDWEFKFGLIGSPHRDFVIHDMASSLSSPDQSVTATFLNTLTLLDFARQSTPPPPYPNGTDEQNKQWQDQMERRRSSYTQLRLNYLRQLVMAIPQKQERARATSLQTLLDYHFELDPNNISQWSTLIALMPDVFSRLPVNSQVRLLEYQWKLIANVEMLPVLRGILNDADKQPDNYEQQDLRSLALRRLYELSPEEGRRLILNEIRRPKPRFKASVLRSLPEETLPELDATLAANLEAAQRPNGIGDTEAISDLIERYATAEILPQVRTVYEAPGVGRWACRIQASLLAYFLRVDPSTGGKYLNKALAARGKDLSRCYASTLAEVARLHMTPEVEDVAIAALDDRDSEVVSQAASVLGEYGSAGAEKPLWRRLEKWHEELQSRSGELAKQHTGIPAFGGTELSGQAVIEAALRNALATGRSWLSDTEKLKRLRELCLTDGSRAEVDRMISGWNYNVYVALKSIDGEPYSISVGHYSLKSLDSLKKKLLQFPKGTLFKWYTDPSRGNNSEAQQLFHEFKAYLDEHGMKLEPAANQEP